MAWLLTEAGTEDVFVITDKFSIGRHQGTKTYPGYSSISKVHCEFIFKENELYIVDMNSKNGTFLDGERIKPETEVLLEDGMTINLGNKKFFLRNDFKDAHKEFHTREIKLAYLLKKTQTAKLRFSVNIHAILKTFTVQSLKSLLTLGFYIPFGRISLKKMILSKTQFGLQAFQYHGSFKKSVKAYVVLLMVLSVSLTINVVISRLVHQETVLFLAAQSLMTFFSAGFFFIKVLEEAFTNTVNNISFRSIFFRSTIARSKMDYLILLAETLLSILTIGVYLPVLLFKYNNKKWANLYFGNKPFRYFADKNEYYVLFLKGFFLTLASFGLYYPWFAVSLHNFHISNLRIDRVSFVSRSSGFAYFKFILRTLSLTILTLGAGAPFLRLLCHSYFMSNLTLKGNVDFNQVIEGARSNTRRLEDPSIEQSSFDSKPA